MIDIEVENKFLVLSEETKFRLEMNFSLFTDDVLPSSVVYWFDLPYCPYNNNLLKGIFYLEAQKDVREFAAKLFICNNKFYDGNLIVRKVNEDSLRASFVANVFPDEFKLKKIADFFKDSFGLVWLGRDSDSIVTNVKSMVNKDYSRTLDQVTFPSVYSPNFYSDFNKGFTGIVNRYDDGFFVNSIGKPNEDGDLLDNKDVLVPFPYVAYILDRVFLSQHFKVKGSFLNGNYSQLLLNNNRALERFEEKYIEYRIETPYITATDTTSSMYISYPVGVYHNLPEDYHHLDYLKHRFFQIDVKVHFRAHEKSTICLAFEQQIGYSSYKYPYTNFRDVEAGEEGVIELSYSGWLDINFNVVFFFYNGSILPSGLGDHWHRVPGTVISSEYNIVLISDSQLNRHSKSFFLSDHLPDIKLNDFVKALKEQFGLAVFLDKNLKIIQFDTVDSVFDADYLDMTDIFTEPTSVDLLETKDNYYCYTGNSDALCKERENDIENLAGDFSAESEFPIPTKPLSAVISADRMSYKCDYKDRKYSWVDDIYYMPLLQPKKENCKVVQFPSYPFPTKKFYGVSYPYTLQQGNSALYGQAPAPDLRFLIWRGMKEVNGKMMPCATSLPTRPQERSTSFEGDGGTNENYGRWFEFLKYAEEVTVEDTGMFSINDLIRLKELFSVQPAGEKDKRKIRIGNINYIPKQVTVELSVNGIESVQAKLLKEGKHV